MKGSMREKRPGYWEFRVFEGADPLTGKRKYRTKVFRGTKRQASSVLVTEVDGGVVEPKKCTVAELLDAWLDHIEHIGRSPSTLYGYRRLVRQLPQGFLGQPLAKATPKVLDDLYRLLSKPTTRKPATVLRKHWGRSFELGEVAGSPVTADDFVFPRSPGSDEPLPPNRIGQAWRRLCRQLGIEARLHDLRHLQASLLLCAGEAITTVAARLGHRDTSTTLTIYSHLMPGADQRAAGIVG